MKYFTQYQSPVGQLTLQANDDGLLGSWFDQQKTAPNEFGEENNQHPILRQTIQEYEEYFAGKRKQFDVPTTPQGTDFQKRVWAMLKTIPVGLANGKNPISIIIPCHRVIGKNGNLTGYAGGIDNKRLLLIHESEHSELLS